MTGSEVRRQPSSGARQMPDVGRRRCVLRLMVGGMLAFLLGSRFAAAGSWTNVLTFGPDSTVHSLAVDPTATSVLYAGTASGIFKTTDGGVTWRQANTGLGNHFIFSLAIDPVSPSTVYASTNDAGIFKTMDGGDTWAAINTGLGSTTYVPAVAVVPGATSTVLAATNAGVFKSTNAGTTWNAINHGLTDLHVTSLLIDLGSPSTVYAGTANGIFRSQDGGANWTMVYGQAGTYALAMNPARTAIYAGPVSTGPSPGISPPRGGGVVKSTDGGVNWTTANTGLPDGTAVNAFCTDPNSAATLYLGTSAGGVFRSTDGGGSWTPLNDGLTTASVYAIATDFSSPVTLYAGTGSGVFKRTSGNEGTCLGSPDTLCLNNARFQVQVRWRVSSQGISGTGQAVSMTSDTGSFWFFSANNVELVVKVVDGRAFNSKFWVFYGALSNVEYTITVTDTQTGAVKIYSNPSGTLASVADTAAF